MAIQYFCSGFDKIWSSLGKQIRSDLKAMNYIFFIPGSNTEEGIKKAEVKYIPEFIRDLEEVGIHFEQVDCLTLSMKNEEAIACLNKADMIVLMGGNPFLQQDLYTSKGLTSALKKFDGVILGVSAGSMNMSKYIMIPPCSEEYPEFCIKPGLNLAGISIYPHNNFEGTVFPESVDLGGEITISKDLLFIAREYEPFYCLQDYEQSDGQTAVSLIRYDGNTFSIIKDNNAHVWLATGEDFIEVNSIEANK